MSDLIYLAHSGNEPLREHLELVANRASSYAKLFDAEKEAFLAGLIHDIGKYSNLFLRRLENKEKGLDHWSPGGYIALTKYKWNALAAALAIQGHHIGLQHGLPSPLSIELSLDYLTSKHPLNLRLTEKDPQLLLERFSADGFTLPKEPASSLYDPSIAPVAGMLDIRMLYSSLVDADFIETEAHFNRDIAGNRSYREQGLELQPEKALKILLENMNVIRQHSKAHASVNSIRDDLFEACIDAGKQSPGIFTLTAPTGAGKTLAMLAFAIKHACEYKNSFKRIIFVIPYLTIIEQTAIKYRAIFSPSFGNQYILEQHSLAGTRERDGQDESEKDEQRKLLSENWDAPIIVTTSVQFFESLFANRPAACRKLHRLSGSIILFDEVQTLPSHLAVPSLGALSRLAERYNTSVVFSTATQPAFTHLDKSVSKYSSTGWKAREIVPQDIRLFERARRTKVSWEIETPTTWNTLADSIAQDECRKCLCILNVKKHAVRLIEILKERNTEGVFHLSTSLCPAHRKSVLKEVIALLGEDDHRPCRLISTQCVEAGVDVDFPVVYRAFGPLDAIAQAAGRCNRNGRNPENGEVRVFIPEPEPNGRISYPGETYRQAAEITKIILTATRNGEADIYDNALFNRYYITFYDLTGATDISEKLEDALQRRDFRDAAANYRLIEKDSVNVLVPYEDKTYKELRDQMREKRKLTREWIQKATPYSVSLFRPKQRDAVWNYLEPVYVNERERSDEWFIYLEKKHYDDLLGLIPPEGPEAWMVYD